MRVTSVFFLLGAIILFTKPLATLSLFFFFLKKTDRVWFALFGWTVTSVWCWLIIKKSKFNCVGSCVRRAFRSGVELRQKAPKYVVGIFSYHRIFSCPQWSLKDFQMASSCRCIQGRIRSGLKSWSEYGKLIQAYMGLERTCSNP